MRFFSPKEAVDIRMLGNDDYQKRDRMRLLKWSKYVWQDMNLTTVKKAVRRRYKINKRTNSVDMDCKFLQLSRPHGVDHVVFLFYTNSMKAIIKVCTAAKEFNQDQKNIMRRVAMVLIEHDLSVVVIMKVKRNELLELKAS